MGIFSKKKIEPTADTFSQYDHDAFVTSFLRHVYMEDEHAEYTGGTLIFRAPGEPISVNGKIHLIFANLDDDKWSERSRFWIGMCYIKCEADTKNPGHLESALDNYFLYPKEAIGNIFRYLDMS